MLVSRNILRKFLAHTLRVPEAEEAEIRPLCHLDAYLVNGFVQPLASDKAQTYLAGRSEPTYT